MFVESMQGGQIRTDYEKASNSKELLAQ